MSDSITYGDYTITLNLELNIFEFTKGGSDIYYVNPDTLVCSCMSYFMNSECKHSSIIKSILLERKIDVIVESF